MNQQLPENPEGRAQPFGHPFGADSGAEPTQPIAPQPDGPQPNVPPSDGPGVNPPGAAHGFGTPSADHPGYQQSPHGGYSYPPANPFRTTAYGRTGYQQHTPYGPGNPYGQAFTSEQPGPYGTSGGTTPPAAGNQPPSRRGNRRRGPLVIASLALAAVIGAGAGIGSYAFLDQGSGSIASPIAVTTQTAPQQAKADGTVEGAAKVIEPSVVTITVQAGNSGDIGSGVVLDKKGHILTNNHVVAALSQTNGGLGGMQPNGPSKITVTFSDGRTASAKVVGTDETDDLAVIKVSGVKNLVPADFAKSGSISTGQSVVAVGAPLGLSQTVTSGIVSNVARPVRSGENNDAVYMAVQTDAAINPGNSGGPLVDLNGSVVGINSSIASTDEGSGGEQAGNIGIGFAIPSDVAVRVASQLIATGKSDDAVLGVTISGTDGSSLGSTTTGVELQSVKPGSAAAAAGLQAGDVVTSLNGFTVTTADGLIAATHYYAPGTAVSLTYQRDGQSHTTRATLGAS
jgi:putative serine protease PepD